MLYFKMKKNISKKIISSTCLIFIFIGMTVPLNFTAAQSTSSGGCYVIDAQGKAVPNGKTRENCVSPAYWSDEAITVTGQDPNYHLLAPLPCTGDVATGCVSGQLTTYDPTGAGGGALGLYLNLMIKIFIGICAVLAVIMIVMGGMEYMTSELISNKEEGKKRITGAIFGLLLALGAYTLLYTINPDLLNTDLSSLKDITVNVTLADKIKSYTGQGTCTPITDSSNQCSPDNLTKAGFANGTQASSICNGESKGSATLASGVDKCSDGNSFSFGLFQINILAHANEIPGGVCSGIFKTNGNGVQGTCLQQQSGICYKI